MPDRRPGGEEPRRRCLRGDSTRTGEHQPKRTPSPPEGDQGATCRSSWVTIRVMSERFKVDLRGIIDLAANHLYQTPEVFVRELIQNALDAITARRSHEVTLDGEIRIELTPGTPPTLSVTDNGVGLTVREVHDFLSTVGGSSKREDLESLAERTADAPGFLGRFGIGLLSCFMVTDEIIVVTRSARDPGSPAVEWRGRADGSYSVREMPTSSLAAGTSVYLTAKEDAEEYFERDRMIELARRYGEMLPTRILVAGSGDETRVNRSPLPWEMSLGKDDIALEDYCQDCLGFRPIDVFPINAPSAGLSGFAFIRPTRAEPWSNSHRLYAHRMFVADRVYGLLPEWATFVGTSLNATGLRLTASREGVHHNDELEKARDEIGAAIRGRLVHLLRSEPARFDAVMAVHDTEIRGLAVKDADLFAAIIDLLEFDTTLGPIRFGLFRREHERLMVARTSEQFRRLIPIARNLGLRIFSGGYTYHEELLARAAQRYPDLELVAFDTADLANLLAPPEDHPEFERLLEAANTALSSRACEVVVRDFAPENIPAFFALGLDAEYHRHLDRTKSMSSGLWQEVLDAMAPRPESVAPTRLCLNARNALVRQLAALSDAPLQSTAVEILYVQALMSGQHALVADELSLLNNGLNTLLTRAVSGVRPA